MAQTHPEVLGEKAAALALPWPSDPSQQHQEVSATAGCWAPHDSPVPWPCWSGLRLPPPVWSHLPPSLGRRPSEPSHQCKTRTQISLYSVPDRSLPGWRQLHRSLGLVAFGFQTLSPHAEMPFPQGWRRRRRWLYRATSAAPHLALPFGTPVAPSCSCRDIGACGREADGLVAWLVVLLAVVHPRHHCQDEGLRDQQLRVHLWKRRRVIIHHAHSSPHTVR